MYVKAKSEHKYLLKLVLSGIHLKIIGVYAIKCLVIKLCEDFLAFHTSFIRVLGYTSCDTSCIRDRDGWAKLACFGAIHRRFQTRGANDEWVPSNDEWQYYISSRPLSATELLHHARMEWRIESMHWLLDVHFGEDFCRAADKNEQKNLNVLRKLALNLVRFYQMNFEPRQALSRIMFNCYWILLFC